MGKLTDFVMAKKIKELSGEERIKIIRKENERKMAEIREKVRKREQDKEWEENTRSVFADVPEKQSNKSIICVLSDDVLNN